MTTVFEASTINVDADADLRRRAAALLVVRASGHLADGQRRYPRWELSNHDLQRLLAAGVGGVILLGGSAAEVGLRTRQLRSWSDSPLLLCADVEEGVGQRFEGASWLVPPLALARLHRLDPERAVDLARRYGHCTGEEARQLGLNWVLGPVCDVNNNPANPVINVRAWGEDAATAGLLAASFLEGLQSQQVLGCAKHFPGHGDTTSDSHLELPVLPHDRARLQEVELPPFRRAIAAGVGSVMTAHVLLPALDARQPATLSQAVLTGLLRNELQFGGLVVTDALLMEAITARHGPGEAAVLALEAGADLVLMPADADAAIDAIVSAVRTGRLSGQRLDESLRRRAQALAGIAGCPGGPDPMGDLPPDQPLGDLSNGPSPAHRRLAEELIAASLETVSGNDPSKAAGVNLIRVDSAVGCPFLPSQAPALDIPEAAGWRTCLLEGRSPGVWSGDPEAPLALQRLPGDGPVLLQLFLRGNPFRGNAGGEEPWPAVIRQLQRAGRLTGLAVYGSPYLWQTLCPWLEPGIPAVYSPGQMPAAQSAVLARLGFGAGRPLAPAGAAASNQAGGFTD